MHVYFPPRTGLYLERGLIDLLSDSRSRRAKAVKHVTYRRSDEHLIGAADGVDRVCRIGPGAQIDTLLEH
jgi:hypothetical protein